MRSIRLIPHVDAQIPLTCPSEAQGLKHMDSSFPISTQRPNITAEQWAAIQPDFENLYLQHDKTLVQVSEILKRDHGFDATERQYKTRIKEWGLNRKRIKNEVYRAMYCILRQHGDQTTFLVPVGCKYETKSGADVNKEINRQKHQDRYQDMEYSTAEEILDKAGVRIHPSSERLRVVNESGGTPELSFDTESMGSNSPIIYTPKYDTEESPLPLIKQEGDYEFNAALAWSSLDSAQDRRSEREIASFFGLQHIDNLVSPWDAEKQAACECIAPYVVACLSRHCDQEQRMLSNPARGDEFRALILSHSRYVLPCLHWMIVAFGCITGCEPLVEFLRRSCAIIDQAWPTENDMVITYGNVFKYALAHYGNDHVSRDEAGARLELAVARAQETWGIDSPNTLITEYHWSLHLMDKGDHGRAESKLSSCAARAERTLGASNVITINCLCRLAICNREKGQNQQAIQVLEEALRRFRHPLGPFAHFYFEMTSRLARLYTDIGNVEMIERLLLTTVQGRVEYTGLDDGATWAAIERYCILVSKRGRAGQAFSFYQNMVNQHIHHQNVDWYKKKEYFPDDQMHTWYKLPEIPLLQRSPSHSSWFQHAQANLLRLTRTHCAASTETKMSFNHTSNTAYSSQYPG